MDNGNGVGLPDKVDTPSDALVALFANGVELLSSVEHLLRRVPIPELRHERLHRNFLVPDVAELRSTRPYNLHIGCSCCLGRCQYTKLTLSGFAVRSCSIYRRSSSCSGAFGRSRRALSIRVCD